METLFYNIWRTSSAAGKASLVAAMQDEAPQIAAKPGFRSLKVLAGEDDRVLVEGRWASRAAFEAAIADDEDARNSRKRFEAFGRPEPAIFTEAFRVGPAPDRMATSVAVLPGASADVNGQTIHYVRAGAGPVVVLVHGYPESSQTWRKVIPELAKRFTVIAPDTRGTGSSSVATDFSIEDTADDVYELVKSLGFREVTLVGQDMGVQIASAYAAKHREDVAGLVVMESPLVAFGLEDLYATFWHFGFLASPFAEMLIAGREHEFFKQFAFGDFVHRKDAFTQSDIDNYIALQTRAGRLNAGFAYYRALLAGKDFFKETVKPPWTFPVLAIDGDHSMNGITAKSFAKVAPNVKALIANDCGHFIQEEQPEFLVEALIDFLSAAS